MMAVQNQKPEGLSETEARLMRYEKAQAGGQMTGIPPGGALMPQRSSRQPRSVQDLGAANSKTYCVWKVAARSGAGRPGWGAGSVPSDHANRFRRAEPEVAPHSLATGALPRYFH